MTRTVKRFHRAISLCVCIAFLATGNLAPASCLDRDGALAPSSDLSSLEAAIRYREGNKGDKKSARGVSGHVIGELGHFTQGQIGYLYRKHVAKAQRPDPQQLARLIQNRSHLEDMLRDEKKFEIIFVDLGKDMYFQNKEGAKAAALTYEKSDGRRVVLISQ